MINIIASPLEQFEIVAILPLTFLGLNFSVTNSVLFMFISCAVLLI